MTLAESIITVLFRFRPTRRVLYVSVTNERVRVNNVGRTFLQAGHLWNTPLASLHSHSLPKRLYFPPSINLPHKCLFFPTHFYPLWYHCLTILQYRLAGLVLPSVSLTFRLFHFSSYFRLRQCYRK